MDKIIDRKFNFQPELLLASKTSELSKIVFTDYLKMKGRKDTKTIYTLELELTFKNQTNEKLFAKNDMLAVSATAKIIRQSKQVGHLSYNSDFVMRRKFGMAHQFKVIRKFGKMKKNNWLVSL